MIRKCDKDDRQRMPINGLPFINTFTMPLFHLLRIEINRIDLNNQVNETVEKQKRNAQTAKKNLPFWNQTCCSK